MYVYSGDGHPESTAWAHFYGVPVMYMHWYWQTHDRASCDLCSPLSLCQYLLWWLQGCWNVAYCLLQFFTNAGLWVLLLYVKDGCWPCVWLCVRTG